MIFSFFEVKILNRNPIAEVSSRAFTYNSFKRGFTPIETSKYKNHKGLEDNCAERGRRKEKKIVEKKNFRERNGCNIYLRY